MTALYALWVWSMDRLGEIIIIVLIPTTAWAIGFGFHAEWALNVWDRVTGLL